jgi:single-stranded-DNA-specific exonuclease
MRSTAWKPDLRRWEIADPHPLAADLARQLRTSELVGQVLLNRGLGDPDLARAFLAPKFTDLHDPTELVGCAAAARRIARAVDEGESVAIYGDYDVDGMTGSAILHRILRHVGAIPRLYVPHRIEEGYGVNAEALESLLAEGTDLLVTVDCGIGAREVLAAAGGRADVIVTDHHALPEKLPDVAAVVHPALGDYPNPDLCGAGVAMKLAWQVAREVGRARRVDEELKQVLLEATCLAALGTIADVVPLLGENRILATYGLRGLPATRHVGLRALLGAAGLDGESLDAYHVGFVLAPRLNAAGRMGHAEDALELLTTADPARAHAIAEDLAKKNTQRQAVQRDITAEACALAEQAGCDLPDCRAIVLASENWHGGVIGIVASKLVERYHRPTVLIALNGDGTGQGSGRSIPGYDLAEALHACREHLVGCGGHAMAGGLSIRREKIEDFAAALADHARQRLAEEHLQPVLHLDAETTLPALGFHVVDRLGRMAPFGQGNDRPALAVRGCRVVNPPKRIGRNGQAVSMLIEQDGVTLRAVGFGMGDLADRLAGGGAVDLAVRPQINTFRGRSNVELHLLDVREA